MQLRESSYVKKIKSFSLAYRTFTYSEGNIACISRRVSIRYTLMLASKR